MIRDIFLIFHLYVNSKLCQNLPYLQTKKVKILNFINIGIIYTQLYGVYHLQHYIDLVRLWIYLVHNYYDLDEFRSGACNLTQHI